MSDASNSCIRPATIFTIPVDRDTLFSDHRGVYKSRIESRQRRLIVKSTFIKSFLHPGEVIRCVTTAYSPLSELECDLAGPAFLFFKRAFLVFTNRRILHIPTRFNRSPRAAVSQVMYGDCAGLEIKGRSLEVLYHKGCKEVFTGIGRMELKKLRLLLAGLCLSPKKEGSLSGRVWLCPRCTHSLTAGTRLCDACQMNFKKPFKAGLWSFLVPGGGFFYLGYPLAGSLAALLEIALIVLAALNWAEIITGASPVYGLAVLPTCGLALAKLTAFLYARQLLQDPVPEKNGRSPSEG